MTVKKFDTAPATNSTGGTASEPVNWHTGALLNRTTDIVINYGAPKTWTRDVTWSCTRYDDLHMPNGFLIGGSNGKDHDANFEQNISGLGKWIPMEFVYGFSIDFQQDSTAGHGLYLRNAGIECVNNSGTYIRWGSADRSRQGDYNKHTATYQFTSSERQLMANDGGRFHRFIARCSSRGGTGSRESYVRLSSFRLLYDNTGASSGRWVLPTERSFHSRNDPDIIVG